MTDIQPATDEYVDKLRLLYDGQFRRSDIDRLIAAYDAEKARADAAEEMQEYDRSWARKYAKERAALAERVKALEEALREQWETNHHEHCSSTLPCKNPLGCMWPMPESLAEPAREDGR